MPPPAETFASRLFLGPALRAQPDRRLVTLVREGYETAFEEIVRRYGKPLTRYAATIVGSHGEDVTQDAFSKALLALRRDETEIELRPWLFRIVRNTALNDLRDSPPTPELLAEVIAGGQGPVEELEQREELADLIRRLQALPDRQRAAIVMRELEGLSHDEIAAALGLSDGAARQAIFRARQALRDGLGMLLPLPLLRVLGDHGGELAAGGAGAGGAAAASGALGGAGAGVALKAATATVLVAGAIGAGVAVDHGRHDPQADRAATTDVVAERTSNGDSLEMRPAGSGGRESGAESEQRGDKGKPAHGGDDSQGSSGSGRGRSSGGSGLSGGDGHRDDNHRGGPELETGDNHSGSGNRGSSGQGDSGSGGHQSGRSPGGSSGSGNGSSGGGKGSDDNSGPGSSTPSSVDSGSGGGDSGSGGGNSGSSGDSNSGPGSGSDGGSSGGGSSSEESGSGDSRDSGDGEGFPQQTEPQIQEER